LIPLALYLGYHFVPGVRVDHGAAFTKEFLFNSYLILWGFLLTTAAVGPVVAQFLEWRSNREWKAARVNAARELAGYLGKIIDSYRAFLRSTELDTEQSDLLARVTLDEVIAGLAGFFDSYDSQHVTFNPGMHGAASNIRQTLLPFKLGLETTTAFVDQRRSRRMYLSTGALNDLRALLDLPAIGPDSPLASDGCLKRHGRMSFEVSIGQLVETTPIHRFVELDVEYVLHAWSTFCSAVANPEAAQYVLDETLEFDGDTQARLHAKYARLHIEEPYLIDRVVKKGFELPDPAPAAAPRHPP